jgi:hypothetical protein
MVCNLFYLCSSYKVNFFIELFVKMSAHDLQDMFTNFDNVQVHFLNKV